MKSIYLLLYLLNSCVASDYPYDTHEYSYSPTDETTDEYGTYDPTEHYSEPEYVLATFVPDKIEDDAMVGQETYVVETYVATEYVYHTSYPSDLDDPVSLAPTHPYQYDEPDFQTFRSEFSETFEPIMDEAPHQTSSGQYYSSETYDPVNERPQYLEPTYDNYNYEYNTHAADHYITDMPKPYMEEYATSATHQGE
jgi:hypothetical protein